LGGEQTSSREAKRGVREKKNGVQTPLDKTIHNFRARGAVDLGKASLEGEGHSGRSKGAPKGGDRYFQGDDWRLAIKKEITPNKNVISLLFTQLGGERPKESCGERGGKGKP